MVTIPVKTSYGTAGRRNQHSDFIYLDPFNLVVSQLLPRATREYFGLNFINLIAPILNFSTISKYIGP